jgi:hypothetical protein
VTVAGDDTARSEAERRALLDRADDPSPP